MDKDENGEYWLKDSFVCFTDNYRRRNYPENYWQILWTCLISDNLRGQGYDGAGNMAGKFSGGRARIKEIVPSAEYVHCYAHTLNLSVVVEQTWIPATQGCFVQSLVEIGSVVLEKTFF